MWKFLQTCTVFFRHIFACQSADCNVVPPKTTKRMFSKQGARMSNRIQPQEYYKRNEMVFKSREIIGKCGMYNAVERCFILSVI